MSDDRRYYRAPLNAAVDESAAINALTAEYEDGGSLSNLVWNRRNLYLHPSFENAEGDAMRMVVEGFLAEVESLRSRCEAAEAATASLRAENSELWYKVGENMAETTALRVRAGIADRLAEALRAVSDAYGSVPLTTSERFIAVWKAADEVLAEWAATGADKP